MILKAKMSLIQKQRIRTISTTYKNCTGGWNKNICTNVTLFRNFTIFATSNKRFLCKRPFPSLSSSAVLEPNFHLQNKKCKVTMCTLITNKEANVPNIKTFYVLFSNKLASSGSSSAMLIVSGFGVWDQSFY